MPVAASQLEKAHGQRGQFNQRGSATRCYNTIQTTLRPTPLFKILFFYGKIHAGNKSFPNVKYSERLSEPFQPFREQTKLLKNNIFLHLFYSFIRSSYMSHFSYKIVAVVMSQKKIKLTTPSIRLLVNVSIITAKITGLKRDKDYILLQNTLSNRISIECRK